MPRKAREVSPSGYYHIMMRGIDRDCIYQSSKDKGYLLKLIKEEEQLDLAAYCLMDNHVHFVLHSDSEALTLAFRKINLKYAMHYNFVHDRVGHVFQNRYRSEIVADERYLAHLIRYVHNNPVKAGLVGEARQYMWSSYGEYIGSEDLISLNQKRFILGLFPKGTEEFKAFHVESDEREYLDTAEEIEHHRQKLVECIIADYCRTKGIEDRSLIKSEPQHSKEIIAKLLRHTKLSHRKIAALLQLNANVVHQVSKSLGVEENKRAKKQ